MPFQPTVCLAPNRLPYLFGFLDGLWPPCNYGHVSRLKQIAGLLAVTITLVLIYSLLPLGTAFAFGDDESYEVIKGFMCSKGYKLYTEIWNDQPPVSTVLLAAAFKAWGPSILTARLVAAGFGLVLFSAFHELVRQRSGQWTALLATFFLLASPSVLPLSVSVMLEVPAIGTGLVSAWLLFQWGRHRHWGWLLASGGVMGVALQIKLTAVLVAPAMLLELWLMCLADHRQRSRKRAVATTLFWGGCVVAISVAIGLTWGRGSMQSSWKSHTAVQVVSGYGSAADHPFEPRLLWNHVECVAAAVLCLALLARQRRWREAAFPLTLLLTAIVIHTVHRPWWNYYYLHWAVPLAWLAGLAANEVLKAVFRLLGGNPFSLSAPTTWRGLTLCGLAALAIARSERRLEGAVANLAHRPKVEANPVVKKMREYASRTKWVYAESALYPFHAQLPTPPELAVVMLKRFWSGQISTAGIIATCKQYQVEQLVLPLKDSHAGEWKALLAAEYDSACTDGRSCLYIAKRIKTENSPKPEAASPSTPVH